MLRDGRNRTIEEGDLMAFVGQPSLMDGVVVSVNAPMAMPTPQGQMVLQKIRVLTMYEFTAPMNMNVPMLILDKADKAPAQEALKDMKAALERMGKGESSGGSIIAG